MTIGHINHVANAVTPAGGMQAMADISAGEMEEHFKVCRQCWFCCFHIDDLDDNAQTSGAGEDWLSDTGMASLLHCGQEDMDRWGFDQLENLGF